MSDQCRLLDNLLTAVVENIFYLQEFAFMKHIHKVAILGAGTMGARIAAHFANAGVPSLLLDILPPDAPPNGPVRTPPDNESPPAKVTAPQVSVPDRYGIEFVALSASSAARSRERQCWIAGDPIAVGHGDTGGRPRQRASRIGRRAGA